MKKLSQINEGMFKASIQRSNSDKIRKEDGKKVTTCLDNTVILKNPQMDYNEIINNMFISEDPFEIIIDKLNNTSLSMEEIINARNFKAPYSYVIYDGLYGTSLIAEFQAYSEICDFMLDNDFENNVSEKDYISLCKCVATKLKEIGEYYTYIPYRDSFTIDGTSVKKYIIGYHLKLVDENTVYNWECDQDDLTDVNYLKDFKDDIISEFPELDDTDFICWTFRDGVNIAIPSNPSNIKNFNKYYNYTQEWFKS